MLEKPLGGRGILLGGVPGRRRGQGDGHRRRRGRHERGLHRRSAWRPRSTSTTATSTACASSTSYFAGRASTCYASTLEIEQRLPEMDLVIGAVLVHGAKAPYVIRRDQLALMKRNAVLVDVSIDQGGCFETSRPTTHSDPTFEVDGITHYCVANMPGAVPGHLDLRADQRDAAVRAARRRRGRRAGARRTRPRARRQRGRRQGDLRAGPTRRRSHGAVRGARRLAAGARPGIARGRRPAHARHEGLPERVRHPRRGARATARSSRGAREELAELLALLAVERAGRACAASSARRPREPAPGQRRPLLPCRAVCRRPPSSCARAARPRRRSWPPLA